MPKPYWNEERILEAFADWESEHGCLPSSFDWRKKGADLSHPTDRTVSRIFGSWKEALSAYGKQRKPFKRWTREEIIAAIQEWVEVHGEVPGVDDFRYGDGGEPSYTAIRRIFGSWERAVRTAGFIPLERGITRKTLRRFKPLPRRGA